jgi:hypothetical protein
MDMRGCFPVSHRGHQRGGAVVERLRRLGRQLCRLRRRSISLSNLDRVAGTVIVDSGATEAVAVSPSDNAIFALSNNGNTNSIDRATITGPSYIPPAATSSPIDTSPQTGAGLAVSPDGQTVYSAGYSSLHVVGTAPGSIPRSIAYPSLFNDSGIIPSSVALSPDGATAFVGGYVDGDGFQPAILVGFNLRTGAVSFFLDSGPSSVITDLAVSPDGTTLWATETTETTDPGSAVLRIPLPFSPNSDHVFPNGIPVGGGATAVTISPNGATAYVASAGVGGGLYQMAAADATQPPPTPSTITMPANINPGAGDGIINLAVAPDNRTLLANAVGTTPGVRQAVPSNILLSASIPIPSSPSPTPLIEHQMPVQALSGLAITPDQEPIAILPHGLTATAGTPIHINASPSTVAFGFIAKYQWAFPPGKCTPTTGVQLTPQAHQSKVRSPPPTTASTSPARPPLVWPRATRPRHPQR